MFPISEEVFPSPMTIFTANVILYFTIIYLLYIINKERNEFLCEKLKSIEYKLNEHKEVFNSQQLCISHLSQKVNNLKDLLKCDEWKDDGDSEDNDDYE